MFGEIQKRGVVSRKAGNHWSRGKILGLIRETFSSDLGRGTIYSD
jgi:hypothetical protein